LNSALKWLVIALAGFLIACSSGTDNSEPPAPLTKIEEPLPLILNWKVDTRASANSASYRLRPFQVGDRIYSIDTRGSIVSVDAKYGTSLWRHETGLSAIVGLGGDSTRLVVTSRNGDVAAYRYTGDGLESIWKVSVDSEIRAVPVLDGEQVFVRSVDGKLRSLAASDGSQQWVVSRRVPVLSLTGNSEPLVEGETVFAGFDDGKLIAFDRSNGEVRWESTISIPSGRTEVERLVDLDGRFVLSNGVIYVASFQGRLAAVQAVSGDLLWSRQFSSFQSIAIDDDALYLSADNSDLWSIDRRTGAAFWKQDVLHARKITAPSVIGDGVVVADLDGFLHWFNRSDGRLAGRIRIGDTRSYVQPVVRQDAVVTLDKYGLLASVSLQQ
jgi:outer membrane protein assembly factor BamB